MNNIQGKEQVRAHFRDARASLTDEARAQADAAIAERLFALDAFRDASCILTYFSFSDEVDTHSIIKHAQNAGKTVAIPRCVPRDRSLEWHTVTTFDGLERNAFGIEEPVRDPATVQDIAAFPPSTIALVPGLAFDTHGRRCGYGAGYYDIFLARAGGTAIGLAYDVQVCPNLADIATFDTYDQPMRVVITETRTIMCS